MSLSQEITIKSSRRSWPIVLLMKSLQTMLYKVQFRNDFSVDALVTGRVTVILRAMYKEGNIVFNPVLWTTLLLYHTYGEKRKNTWVQNFSIRINVS